MFELILRNLCRPGCFFKKNVTYLFKVVAVINKKNTSAISVELLFKSIRLLEITAKNKKK